MSNSRKNNVAIFRNVNAGSRLATVKLVLLLFFSSSIGLFSLSANAAELTGTASKIDSGFYDGSYGRGAYWVTRGPYSSIFSVDVKSIIDTDAPNANTNKSPSSIPEGADKPVKYFIYSYYYLDHTNDSSKIGAM